MAANDLSHLLKWESYTLTYFVKNDSVRDDLEIKFLSASSFYLYTRNSFANRTHWFMPTRKSDVNTRRGRWTCIFSLAWWLLFDQLATCSINVYRITLGFCAGDVIFRRVIHHASPWSAKENTLTGARVYPCHVYMTS